MIIKKLFAVLSIFILSTNLHAQTFATTSNGGQVILYKDGTWKEIDSVFLSVKSLENAFYDGSLIRTNQTSFSKSDKATHLIKSKKLPVGFYVNNKYWGMRRGETNDFSEYTFFNKIDDAYAYLNIDATRGITLENAKENCLYGARKLMPDATIRSSEYRTVNGLKVLCTDIIGTMEKYKGEFLTYSYVLENGYVNITVSNSQEKFLKYRQIYEEFLNGITAIE